MNFNSGTSVVDCIKFLQHSGQNMPLIIFSLLLTIDRFFLTSNL